MVKCVDCGYLAVRNVDSRELEEAEEGFREKGTGPMAQIYEGNAQAHLRHWKQPLCFARVHGFSDDFRKAINEKIPEDGRVKEIIQRERQCNQSTDWQQGFTPKEHRETLDRKWMIDFQSKREDDDRSWREEQRKDDLTWRETQESRADRRHTSELWIIGGVVTAALVLGSIVAAIIERGYLLPIWTFLK